MADGIAPHDVKSAFLFYNLRIDRLGSDLYSSVFLGYPLKLTLHQDI